jgi:hypothetical protein
MKHFPLLLLAATLGFAAEDGPRPPARNQRPGQESRQPVPLSPDEQKRLHEAMEKAKQDPAVKEAHEQAAKAQQAAQEAQQKARDITDDAARKADPEVAPILEKIKKAMERRQPDQTDRQPQGQPEGQPDQPGRERGPGQPEGDRPRGDVREPGPDRGGVIPGLSPEEQRRVREAMAKANGDPAVRAAREAAAAAQRKAIEIAEDVARQADPSLAPLFEKMRKAGEPRRPQGENPRGRKQADRDVGLFISIIRSGGSY